MSLLDADLFLMPPPLLPRDLTLDDAPRPAGASVVVVVRDVFLTMVAMVFADLASASKSGT